MFRANLLVPFTRVKKSKNFMTLEDGTDILALNIVWNYHSVLCNISEECRSHNKT